MRKIFCAGFSVAPLAVFVPCCCASASVRATAFQTAEVRHYHLHRPAVQEMCSVVNVATLNPAAEKAWLPGSQRMTCSSCNPLYYHYNR